MDKNIRVLLLEEQGIDCIRFFLSEGEVLDINLNSNDQTSLREMYKKMVSMSLENKLILNLDCQDGYTKLLFKEIAEEFIRDLNVELTKIHSDTTISDLNED